jgi:glycosyltransferase involved in cell wall biosynthesis
MQSTYPHYECIIVDDGSTDETPQVAQQFQVKMIKLSRSHGPAYARNQGAKAASGEILFFIDADIIVYPDTLSKVADTFEKRPDIDALIGSYDDDPGDSSFISQYKNLFHHYVHQISSEEAGTFWTGCGAIRRKVFLAFGGFDTSYKRPAIEDIELGFRLAAGGHKILLQKLIQVKHLKRWTFWGLIKTDVFDRGVPWTKLMLRDRTFPMDLNLKISQRISVILSYLMIFSLMTSAIFFRIPILALSLIVLFVLMMATLVLINHRFYKFFLAKRGFLFTVKMIPMHVLYYLYSGFSLILGMFAYAIEKKD